MEVLGQKEHYEGDDDDIDVDGRVVDCGDAAEVPVATRPCDFSSLFFYFIYILFTKCCLNVFLWNSMLDFLCIPTLT